MRKTILSLSLAVALASTNAVADADMLRAVQGALPAGQALTAGTALALEEAAKDALGNGEEGMVLASILAWYSDDVDALTSIIRAIALERGDQTAATISVFATSYAPNHAENFKQALTVLTSLSPESIDAAIRAGYTLAATGDREEYEKPDDPIAYTASPS